MQTAPRIAAAALAAVLATAPATAGNWTLDGALVERLEADTNFRLAPGNDDALAGAVTGIELELGQDWRRTEVTLDTGFRYHAYGGSGDDGELDGLSDPRVAGHLVHRTKRQELTADLDLSRSPTAFDRIEETGATDEDATETRAEAAAAWTWRATPHDTLSLGAGGELRRFSETSDEFAPSDAVEVSARWGRFLDPRNEAGALLTFRHIEADTAPFDSQASVLSFAADLVRRPTRRHTLHLSGGVGHSWSETDTGDEDTGIHFVADAGFDWQSPGGTTASLSASHMLEATPAGDLRDTTRVAALLGRPLTRQSDLGVDLTFVNRAAGDGTDDDASRYFRFGPRLDVDMTEVWDLGLGVNLRLGETGKGTVHSAGAFLELRRDFVISR